MGKKKNTKLPPPRYLGDERYSGNPCYDGDTLEEIFEEARDDIDCGAFEGIDDDYAVDVYEYIGTYTVGLKTTWKEKDRDRRK